MCKPADVVSLGYASMDHFIRIDRYPAEGQKIPFRSYSVMGGGQAATAAVALSRWGLRVRYVGRVGGDSTGDQSIRWLQEEGVITDSAIRTPGLTSQTAYILVPAESGERTVLWHREPGLNLQARDLKPEWFRDTAVLFIDGHEREAALLAAQWVKSQGGIVVLDAEHIGPYRASLLELTDIAVGSEDFGLREFGTSCPMETVAALKKYGVAIAGVTLGKNGSIIDWGEGPRRFRSIDVETVDTTGAGDIFHAALAYGACKKLSPVRNVSLATVCAGLSCRKLGGRSAIPDIEEALARLAAEDRLEADDAG